MIPLKQLIAQDRRGVFVNLDDFAEYHIVNGHRMACVMDSDGEAPRNSYREIQAATVRLFVRAEDLPKRQRAGQQMRIDGGLYEIDYWNEDMGLYTIGLTSLKG